MKKVFLIVLGTIALSGCATTPMTVQNPTVDRTFAMSKDAVWEKVVEYYARVNIPIKTIEKDSGIIVAEKVNVGRVPYSVCDGPMMHSLRDQLSRFNTFVQGPDGNVRVTVTADFEANYAYMNQAPTVVQCQSTGQMEKEILDYISS